MNLTAHVSSNEDADFRSWLKERIKSYNNKLSPWHRKARAPGYVRYLSIPVLAETGERLGGLTGRIYWGWLAVDDLYIPRERRGRGLGSRILALAEETARKEGCQRVMLETFSFQAPGFYTKQGYRKIGEIPDYPPGVSMIRLMKELAG